MTGVRDTFETAIGIEYWWYWHCTLFLSWYWGGHIICVPMTKGVCCHLLEYLLLIIICSRELINVIFFWKSYTIFIMKGLCPFPYPSLAIKTFQRRCKRVVFYYYDLLCQLAVQILKKPTYTKKNPQKINTKKQILTYACNHTQN